MKILIKLFAWIGAIILFIILLISLIIATFCDYIIGSIDTNYKIPKCIHAVFNVFDEIADWFNYKL